ncbi:hypothetical protein [Absidia glauca]|uniref:IPT/TIG domain-containing protein n=1 Tax=Absidia glauca TaxID=4829 RepID=A0A168MXN8_ABSGL|nr:hypothetical protein [Absidia glauca]
MNNLIDACPPPASPLDQHDSFYAASKSTATTPLDTSSSPYSTDDNDTNAPFRIRVLGIAEQGAKSRVETQIRLNLELINGQGEKVQDWTHVKLPDPLLTLKRRNASTSTLTNSNTHSNRKRGSSAALDRQHHLHNDATDDFPQDTILHLRASVICESDVTRKVKMCQRCVWREWKRADRKKAGRRLGTTGYDETLMERERKRILLFNSDPLLAFHNGECVLPTRITCYSRHHDERQGFRINFTMYDHQGKLVATGTSPPVMITDDHKNLSKLGDKRRRRRKKKSVSPIQESLPTPEEDSWATFDDSTARQTLVKMEDLTSDIAISSSHQPLSPSAAFESVAMENDEDIIKSMDSLASMAAATPLPSTDSCGFLDPCLFFPTLNTSSPPASMQDLQLFLPSLWSSPSSSPTDSGSPTSSSPSSPLTTTSTIPSPLMYPHYQQPQQPLQQDLIQLPAAASVAPKVERMIPDYASLEGGTEITLLGSNFYDGLTCYFGDQQALTAYWSPTTLVCTVPPCSQPGPVLVTLVEQASFVSTLADPHLVFTYQQPASSGDHLTKPSSELLAYPQGWDDPTLQTLTWQVLNLNMTQNFHDARQIALRLLGL